MLATLIIVFREIIEAGLVVGIVMAATRAVPQRSLWVSGGVLAGIVGALIVAAFAGSISNALSGAGQEWFNVGVLSLAVLMLAWHNIWMARHGREIALEMKSIGEAVSTGRKSLIALTIVVGIAVLREGSEVVLFLYGIAVSDKESAGAMMTGGALGLASGGVVATLMYLGLLRIPARRLFAVTTGLITLLAAGMAAQAVLFLQQAGIVTALGQTAWDSSGLIADSSVAGRVLHTLTGYTDQPTWLQLLVYSATLAGIAILMRIFGHTPKHTHA